MSFIHFEFAAPETLLPKGFPGGSECLPAVREARVRSLGWEDPLEDGTATHCSILAWRIPWTEEPGELQARESQSQTRLRD